MNKGTLKKLNEILELAADNIFSLLDSAQSLKIEIAIPDEETDRTFYNCYEFFSEPNEIKAETNEKGTHAGSGCCGFHECIYNGAG